VFSELQNLPDAGRCDGRSKAGRRIVFLSGMMGGAKQEGE